MNRPKTVLIFFVLAFAGGLYAIIYGQIRKSKLRDWPEKYVYNRYEPLNQVVLFIRDLDYKNQYLQYVKDDLSGKNEIPINFPLRNSLPKGEIIYTRKYLPDSSLVEFYSPEYHHRLWGFRTGYIHRKFVYDSLPNQLSRQ